MGDKQPLTRERIVEVSLRLVQSKGPEALTMRRLGETLGVDGTALYRHFRNKDELVRVLGDRILADVVPSDGSELAWRDAVRAICVRLRGAHIEQPQLGGFTRGGPPRQPNELRLTEALLAHLDAAGFDPPDAAAAYHALIELTIGSATIDASVARLGEEERRALYARWRREYGALDPAEFPQTPRHARHLYVGSADDRFEDALDALLDGFEVRVR